MPQYFANVTSLLKSDHLVGNLEGPATDHNKFRKNTKDNKNLKAFRFAPALVADNLKGAGFDVLHIANNHTLDCASTGLSDTVNCIQNAGLVDTGLKNQISYVDDEAGRTAFIGFNYCAPFNDVHNIAAGKALVAEAKKKAAVVIVTFHAGAEGAKAMQVVNKEEYFLKERRGNTVAFSRAMIDSGADAVIGFGPHVLRGIELYKGKLIAYSLGNFLSVGGLSAKGVQGLSVILSLNLAEDGAFISGKLIPIKLSYTNGKKPVFDPSGASIKLIRALTIKYYQTYKMPMNLNIDAEGNITGH
jgi:poly-gamma-glutamate capsule biosynthesis protein CapA/YwtB (metallophosphatase superfamily)